MKFFHNPEFISIELSYPANDNSVIIEMMIDGKN